MSAGGLWSSAHGWPVQLSGLGGQIRARVSQPPERGRVSSSLPRSYRLAPAFRYSRLARTHESSLNTTAAARMRFVDAGDYDMGIAKAEGIGRDDYLHDSSLGVAVLEVASNSAGV
jgi:hypothetical protein